MSILIKSFRSAQWLRAFGTLLLLCGMSGASVIYWRTQSARSGRTIEELMPGYTQARARQRGILMGSFVAELMDDVDALREPGTQAVILLIAAALGAVVCFRVASGFERNE